LNRDAEFFVAESKAHYGGRPRSHRDLIVYTRAFDLAMRLFKLSSSFPDVEKYSLTSQVRRSSRSVCSNISEAWRKRRYKAAFIAKLSDAEAEAGETQTWIEFAVACGYVDSAEGDELWQLYEGLIGTIVGFIDHADEWTVS
jgi:four helix bundle protein